MPDKDGLVGRKPAEPAPHSDWWDWLRVGKRDQPQPSYIGLIEDPDQKRPATGICCSGGGIRSAAFNLGALQVLTKKGVLQRAKYVSAVSGGSYIAASLFMVAKTRTEKEPDGSDPDAFDDEHPPFHPGSAEEQYLRNRSSYLAPDGSGKLFLGFRVLVGLAFNLFFLGLVMVAAGIVLAETLYRSDAYGELTGRRTCAPDSQCFTSSIPGFALATLAIVGGLIVALGFVILVWRNRDDGWRQFRETWAVRLLLLEALLAVLLVLVPILLEVVRDYAAHRGAEDDLGTATSPALPAVGAGSLASLLLAVLLQVRAKASEPASVLQAAKGVRAFFRNLGPRLRVAFAYLAGAVAGPLVLLGMLLFGASFALANSGAGGFSSRPWLLLGGSLVAFGVLYAWADLTSWSLHPFYKRRLCTAFALRRVLDAKRRPCAEERDYEQLVPLSEMKVDPAPIRQKGWPSLIVCAAANISDPGATPPGRGVTSFTFSCDEVGGPLVGGVATNRYEAAIGENRRRDITLPAVVAMSGAALSPSMGKLTRKPLTFLMALANVRLGVWIPNPKRLDGWKRRTLVGRVKRGDCRDIVKRPRPSYLFRELLGRNRVDAKFLYVSDGGHYENLGLVELLRRGCLEIYCFDASGGRSLAALGDAIALARSELQVEIEIDPRKLVPKEDDPRGLAESDTVTGTIIYPGNVKGTIVYARTVMTEAVPWDVHAYHENDATFPHTTTADQLYTDQKFEAYRALGVCAAAHAVEAMTGTIPATVTEHVAKALVHESPEAPADLANGGARPGARAATA